MSYHPNQQNQKPKLYDLNEIDDLLQKSRDTHRDDVPFEGSTMYQTPHHHEQASSSMDLFQRTFVMSVEIERLTNRLSYLEQNKKNILEMEKQVDGLGQTINHWRQACSQKDEELDKLRGDYRDHHALQNHNQDLQSEIMQLKNKYRHLQDQMQNQDSPEESIKLKRLYEELQNQYKNHQKETNKELDEMKRKLATQKQEIDRLEAKNDDRNDVKNQIQDLNQQLQTFKQKLHDSHRDKESLHDQNNDLQHELNQQAPLRKIQALEKLLTQKDGALQQLQQEQENLLEQFESLEKDMNRMKRQQQESSRNHQKDQEIDDLKRKLAHQRQDLEMMEGNQKSDRHELKNDLQDLTQQLQATKQRLNDSQKEKESLNQRNNDLERELDSLSQHPQRKIDALEKLLSQKDGQLQHQQREQQSLYDQLDQMNKDLIRVKNQDVGDLRKLKQQNDNLQSKVRDYESTAKRNQSPPRANINHITQKLDDLQHKHNQLIRDYNHLNQQLNSLPLQEVVYQEGESDYEAIKNLETQMSRVQMENSKLKDDLHKHNKTTNPWCI